MVAVLIDSFLATAGGTVPVCNEGVAAGVDAPAGALEFPVFMPEATPVTVDSFAAGVELSRDSEDGRVKRIFKLALSKCTCGEVPALIGKE